MLNYLLIQDGNLLHSAPAPADLNFGLLKLRTSFEVVVGETNGRGKKVIVGPIARYLAPEGEKAKQYITSPMDGDRRLVGHAGRVGDFVCQRLETMWRAAEDNREMFDGTTVLIEVWESDR